MSYPILSMYFRVALCLVLLVVLDEHATLHAQGSINHINSIDVKQVSDTEMRVLVEYAYSGNFGTQDVSIHATADEQGGTWDPRLTEIEEIPLLVGEHRVTLTITTRIQHMLYFGQGFRNPSIQH